MGPKLNLTDEERKLRTRELAKIRQKKYLNNLKLRNPDKFQQMKAKKSVENLTEEQLYKERERKRQYYHNAKANKEKLTLGLYSIDKDANYDSADLNKKCNFCGLLTFTSEASCSKHSCVLPKNTNSAMFRPLKPAKVSKQKETIIFEEPLIEMDMEPTEDVDPLSVDPSQDTASEICTAEVNLSDFDIFSNLEPSPEAKKEEQISIPQFIEPDVIVKEEADGAFVYIKEEPKDQFLPEEEPEITGKEFLAKELTAVKYLCSKCTFRSTDKEEVNQHHITNHRVSTPRPCGKCDYVAKTVRELEKHKKLNHPRKLVNNIPTLPSGEFKCPHCEFKSFYKSYIRTHSKVHTRDAIYTCDKCPYSAISKLNMENHAARHLHKNRRRWKFKCPHCGLSERTEKLLSRHLILHGEGEMITCHICPYKSPYLHIISHHLRLCHGIIGEKRLKQEQKWKRRMSSRKVKCRYTYVEVNSEGEEGYVDLPRKDVKRRVGRPRKQEVEKTEENENLTEKKEEKETNHENYTDVSLATNASNVEKEIDLKGGNSVGKSNDTIEEKSELSPKYDSNNVGSTVSKDNQEENKVGKSSINPEEFAKDNETNIENHDSDELNDSDNCDMESDDTVNRESGEMTVSETEEYKDSSDLIEANDSKGNDS